MCIQLFVQQLTFSFISKGNLILQIYKAIIYRCSRQHKYLCLNTLAYNLIKKLQVSVFFLILTGYFSTITKIM